ncbi:MAG: heme A synthase [Acidimicrobiia bacterium]
MSPAARWTVSPAGYRRIAWFALASQVGIVVTGAAVRLTKSGLGCTDWPGCSEERFVPEWGFHHWVEFGNRLLIIILAVAAIAAVVGARRRRPYRPGLQSLGWILLGGIFAQAIIGAVLVKLELDPRLTVLHFVASIVLIVVAVLLVHRSAADGALTGRSLIGLAATDRPPSWPAPVKAAVAVVAAAVTVVVGTGTVVTGSGPHGGDARADRFGFELSSVTRIHSIAMWVFLASLLVLTLLVVRRPQRGGPGTSAVVALRSDVYALLALTAVQAVVGYLQYGLGVPAGLVAIHVTGSAVLWSAAVALVLKVGWGAVRTAPAEAPATPAEAPRHQVLSTG